MKQSPVRQCLAGLFCNWRDYDLAILDINIIGGNSFPIAAAIAHRGIPFMFCSGYGRLGIPEVWVDRRCVAKPFSAEQLNEALSELLQA
ncbi:Response regulator receiver [Pseudomonas syringae pv. broussonetiae]|nr:Response regulator receiver [Pseudomonas syringae pv. broussonetiae]KPX45434.1 Response regulator [Pseudomonas ficuserectae]RMS39188.1 Response regulator receiver [Pseudomonas ficuserectae]RMT25405.1 Response regulator [Pseudomonas savastanoi]